MSIYYLRPRKMVGVQNLPTLFLFRQRAFRGQRKEREAEAVGILPGLCLWVPIFKKGKWHKT